MDIMTGSARSYTITPKQISFALSSSISFKDVDKDFLKTIKGRPYRTFKNRSKKFNNYEDAFAYAKKLSIKTKLNIVEKYSYNQQYVAPHIFIDKEVETVQNEGDFISHRIEETGFVFVEPRFVGYDYLQSTLDIVKLGEGKCVVCSSKFKPSEHTDTSISVSMNMNRNGENQKFFIEAICSKCLKKVSDNKKKNNRLMTEVSGGYYDSVRNCKSKEEHITQILDLFSDDRILNMKYLER